MNEPATDIDEDIDTTDIADINSDSESDSDADEANQNDNEQSLTIAEKAAEMGHKSKDIWVSNGGDPDEWQPPEVFLQLKPALSRMKEQSRQIKSQADIIEQLRGRSETQTKLYAGQVDSLRMQLNQDRDAAVEESDVDKVKLIQQQIDNLPPTIQQTPNTSNMSQVLVDWNADSKNDWYKTDEAKQALADKRFQIYKSQNYSDIDAIRLMESDVNTRFTPVNPNRSNAPTPESGSKPGKKAGSRQVSMADLTSDERSAWNNAPNMWKDQKEFLKLVAKVRAEKNE